MIKLEKIKKFVFSLYCLCNLSLRIPLPLALCLTHLCFNKLYLNNTTYKTLLKQRMSVKCKRFRITEWFTSKGSP